MSVETIREFAEQGRESFESNFPDSILESKNDLTKFKIGSVQGIIWWGETGEFNCWNL
jgi:hypothetical protein